jgi:hypothetical protein
MADSIHKYYCTRCDKFLYENTLPRLATTVNYHVTAFHPSDFANWTETSITSSTQYSGTSGPLPEYLQPYGTTARRGSVLPVLTVEDRAMLAAGHVIWD